MYEHPLFLSNHHLLKSAVYLLAAPMLVDMDVKYDFLECLRRVRGIVVGKEEGRIDFLIQALDAQVEATGNAWRRKQRSGVSDWAVATAAGNVDASGALSVEIAQVVDLFPHLVYHSPIVTELFLGRWVCRSITPRILYRRSCD